MICLIIHLESLVCRVGVPIDRQYVEISLSNPRHLQKKNELLRISYISFTRIIIQSK